VRRYQIVHAFVHATIAGLLYLFLRYVAVIDQHPFADYIRGAAILLLPFLFNRSAFIANFLIEKVPFLSVGIRKLLSGKDFIEGDWPLVVIDRETRTPTYFGFLTITYEGGQLLVHGKDWGVDGLSKVDGSPPIEFQSEQSLYEDRKLRYHYIQGTTLHKPTMEGYTKIFFFPGRGPIERHAGEFIDKQNNISPPFYAKRLCYGLFGRRLRTKEEKIEAAKCVWEGIASRIKNMRELDISSDFV